MGTGLLGSRFFNYAWLEYKLDLHGVCPRPRIFLSNKKSNYPANYNEKVQCEFKIQKPDTSVSMPAKIANPLQ